MGLYLYSVEICDAYVWDVGMCVCVCKVIGPTKLSH